MKIRLFQYISSTRVAGPGKRACIQVQGCPIRCRGCAVPQTWSTKRGSTVTVEYLMQRLIVEQAIEGITFLGGEPFAQAASLARLGEQAHERGLSVVTFSGYTLEYIKSKKRDDFAALLKATDLLIDGPFCRDELDVSRPWVGSKNQRFHFLTDRYDSSALKSDAAPNKLEVRIKPDGRVFINGLAPYEDLKGLVENESLVVLPTTQTKTLDKV